MPLQDHGRQAGRVSMTEGRGHPDVSSIEKRKKSSVLMFECAGVRCEDVKYVGIALV
jgi:hypothetical protein